MSDVAQGPGWWMASDHKWYPPELHPDRAPVTAAAPQGSSHALYTTSDAAPTPYWNETKAAQGQGPAGVATTATFFGTQGTEPKPSSPGRNRRRLVVGAVGVGVAVILAVGLVVVLGGGNGGLSGKTANQVLATTVAAAMAKGSVHLTTTNSKGATGGGTYDIGLSQGQQTVYDGGQGNAEILVLPGHAYVKGDGPFLQNSFGLSASSASQYAGKWISFVPSDPGYQQIVAGDTLSSALIESTPTGTLTLTPARTLDGRAVVGLSGGLPRDDLQSGAKGTQVLYVSKAAPYLPVEVVTSGSLDGQSGTTTVTYSLWGESLSIAAPAGATPASSISQ